MTPAVVETLVALIAFYTLGFLWLVLPAPELQGQRLDKPDKRL